MNAQPSPEVRTEVTTAASRLLADSYTLYLKTHNFHWNVTGPMFSTLHALFELQYTELALAVDEIAERIRALGAFAPGGFTIYRELTQVQEADGVPSAQDMLHALAGDQATVVEAARALFRLAEADGDQATADLAVRRIEVHEKNAWMLRAHLG